jgi:hypothetical protein
MSKKYSILFFLLYMAVSGISDSLGDVVNEKKPLLTTIPFDKDLVCLPDPYVVLEQVLRWEIEYLRSPEIKTLDSVNAILLKKHNELSKLQHDCLKKYNK